MQQKIEQLQGLLPKQEVIKLDYHKHCILYTILDHWWKIKGNTVLYISIKTWSSRDFGSQHYLQCVALVIKFLNNHALQRLEINDAVH